MKIEQLIAQREKEGKKWFSFEFYPYKTTEGVYNLFERIDRLAHLEPLFADITWGAGGSTADLSLEIAAAIQNYICIETQMHLTCTNMEKEMFSSALEKCKEKKIQNILALRGDPPKGQDRWTAVEGGFQHAVDLVKFIRQEHGNYFGICVAGYPEGHSEAESYEKDIQYLKEKVDAGATIIITQLFYDYEVFLKFVSDCRNLGIKCPIVPGIMPITSYSGLQKIIAMSKTKVPQSLLTALEAVKDNAEEMAKIGTQFVAEMVRTLFAHGVSGIHVYTMNQEPGVRSLLQALDMLSERASFPWRPAVLKERKEEDVRPIFWANRPKSYLVRTKEWESFPSGRWGENRSPAYGEPGNWHNLPALVEINQKYQEMWGSSLSNENDVFNVFVSFVEGKINMLPWNEVPLREESLEISAELLRLNRNGFLTINSQPRLNAVDSSHPQFGWGEGGGYVYQKAYVECFTSPENLEKILVVSDEFPSISLHSINKKGDVKKNKHFRSSVNAVTWGIFPNSEVIQPTVFDPNSLADWKDEAFFLWKNTWANLYPEGSVSRKVLDDMIESYYLVTMVDNDFINGDIFSLFTKIGV